MQNYYLTRRLTFEEINIHYKDDNEIINMALYNTLDNTKIKKLLHIKTSCIKKDLTKLNQELLKENINTKRIVDNIYCIADEDHVHLQKGGIEKIRHDAREKIKIKH